MQSFRKYIIQKGNHYCNRWFPSFIFQPQGAFRFTVRFDESVRYRSRIPSNQEDINKLLGFTDGFSIYWDKAQRKFRWKHSCRVGWNYYQGTVRLYGYSYASGIREEKLIACLPVAQEIECSAELVGKSYMVQVGNQFIFLKRTRAANRILGLLLRPYFGGDEVAPHDITVLIKRY